MLLLHETHEVIGAREEDFETVVRERWVPAVAAGDGARFLSYLHHAHGTGVSYNVVTLTALADGAAWETLVRRVDGGDLAEAARALDDLRHDVTSKILVPLPWSPLRAIDLGDVPLSAERKAPPVFMEDTVWPYEGRLEEYVERAGSHYAAEMAEAAKTRGTLLAIEGAFRPAFGSGRRREVVLWQRVTQTKALSALVSREVPEQYKRPGTWMHDALALRDRWQSRLLRSATWSPWP